MDKILCWNVRGLNRLAKQKEVRSFIHSHQIKQFCLLETRVKAPKMGDLYLTIFPNWCFTSNPCHRKNGRIVLAWDSDAFTVDIVHMESQLIHCQITPRGDVGSFFATFVYGFNTTADRIPLWNSLVNLAPSAAWIIMGDFNAIMEFEDKIGSPVRFTDILPMRQYMATCQLNVVKTAGRLYTWNNKQQAGDRVFTRIDIVLTNSSWDTLVLTSEAMYLPEGEYDHCPMILTTYNTSSQKKPFRFYNMWTTSSDFVPIVEKNWSIHIQGCHMFRVVQKLKGIKADLKTLNKAGFNNVEVEQVRLKKKLSDIQDKLHDNPLDTTLATEEKTTAMEFRLAHERYISFLQQIAKFHWLEHGDENSRYFY
ncbi:uncharacterized protein [Spinacia oleracea]|uniref:Endonuclease/exonuclease/phosphatase domain-containing protein n=1 Tax=Spinacia oleracea TaxID=3562 RepID=A0A9R0HVF6_SPIOL|nr:uncharacterized protein LOC110777479 [Spinacia oleracea]